MQPLAGGILAVTFLLHFPSSFALPHLSGIVRPLGAPASYDNLSRRASQDPSCPPGFSCSQSSCPDGVVCPSGHDCVNFEGTYGCAVPGLSWCALNPSTFEAVGCDGGTCCHGNCYVKDAVCCDNPGVQCSIGDACNVCAPGEQCSNGGCQPGGSGGGTPPVTTTMTTIQSPPGSTRSNPGPTSTTSSQQGSSSSTSTTSTPPNITPTAPSQVQDYKYIGCYKDPDINNRVVVADKTVDASSTGMTVEKCVAFAQQNNWQYAGVEFGSECFVGNTIHNAETTSAGDCFQTCAGDASETCGNGNRIQIYQDTTWSLPTLQELVDDLNAYNATLEQARSAIATYRSDMQQWKQDSGSNAKARRQVETPVLTPTLRLDLEHLQNDFSLLKAIQATLRRDAARVLKGFNLGKGLDITIPGGPLINEQTAKDLDDAVQTSSQALDQVTNAAETDNNQIEPALEQDIVPTLEVAADLAVTANSATIIGIASIGEAVATGVFATLAAILAALLSSPGGGGPDDPPKPTQTQKPTATSTSSSTTCTMTATQTPIIIITQTGTTRAQYNDLVSSLPKNADNIQKTDSWLPNWIYIATLDQCTSEKLWDNPIVLSMSIDATVSAFSDQEGSNTLGLSSSVGSSKRSAEAKSNSTASPDYPAQKETAHGRRAEPGPNSKFKQQTPNAPGHLSWLTQLSRYTELRGTFMDFDEFLFDDSVAETDSPPTVYILDSDFLNSHQDFASRVIASWAPTLDGSGKMAQIFDEPISHGTCMTSLAAGSFSGVAKRAKVVTVQLPPVLRSTPKQKVSRAVFALLSVLEHAISSSALGRAVLSMSFGFPVASLWWPDLPRGGIKVPPQGRFTDPFQVYLPVLAEAGIVPVCSAGNEALSDSASARDLSFKTPRAAGGVDSALIVVGNAQSDGTRNPTSQSVDNMQRGILSIYAVGTNVDCAIIDGDDNTVTNLWGVEPAGTSQAAATVAGMAAYVLAHPIYGPAMRAGGMDKVASNVKGFLQATGRTMKGDAGTGDGIPRAALGERVPCAVGTLGRPPIPAYYVPSQADGRTLLTRDITNGQMVLATEQCWDLP